jgi:lipoprotein-anchoring transpeptidase ErfK/SrfK
MNQKIENIKSLPRNNTLEKRWILLIILLTLLLLIVRTAALIYNSNALVLGNLQATRSITPTTDATATSTSTPTRLSTATATTTSASKPTLLSTAAATATTSSQPLALSSTPEITVMVSGYKVNLRNGPGTNYSKIRQLTSGEMLTLLERMMDNSWLYVKTSDGQDGWIKTSNVNLLGVNLNQDHLTIKTPPPTLTSTPVVLTGIEGHWIDIDLSEQMLYAYEGTDQVASFLVSTGISLFPTEVGQYHIYVKYLKSGMRGSDYYLPDVPYTMYYSGDFSIHGTYWHHSFGTPMSHGCVNMDTKEAEWLYNWASVGTLVNIHQ